MKSKWHVVSGARSAALRRRSEWALLLVIAITFARSASAQAPTTTPPPAPAACIDLAGATDLPELTDAEWGTLCNPSNVERWPAELVCQNEKQEFLKLRKELCAGANNPADAKKRNRLRDLYRMNGEPLAPAAGSATTPTTPPAQDKTTVAQNEAAFAAGAASVVAQGVADFLVKRAEETTSQVASERVLASLCKGESSHLFPNLCALYDKQTPRIGLGAMRSALIKDWDALPESAVLHLVAQPGAVEEHGELLCALDVAYAVQNGVRAEKKLEPLLRVEAGDIRVRKYAITKSGPEEDVKELQAKCDPMWKAIAEAAEALAGAKEEVLASAPNLSAPSVSLVARAVADRSFATSTEAGIALIESFFEMVSEARLIESATGPDVHRDNAVRAAFAVLRQAYLLGSGAGHDQRISDALEEIEELVVLGTNRDWSSFVVQVAESTTLAELFFCGKSTDCKVDPKVRATLTLVADIAQADSSDGVATALDNFAAPVGTWKAKFDKFSVALNGYVGIKPAYEITFDTPGQEVSNGAVVNPVLSVGTEFSWPICSGRSRMGFYVQLIDIGNVASVRLSDDGSDNLVVVETTPDVEFAQLFAPGLFYIASLGRSPFVLGVGGSFTPDLRTLEGGGTTGVAQFGGFLAVDIPIIGN